MMSKVHWRAMISRGKKLGWRFTSNGKPKPKPLQEAGGRLWFMCVLCLVDGLLTFHKLLNNL
jgi:hypothetical protein